MVFLELENLKSRESSLDFPEPGKTALKVISFSSFNINKQNFEYP